MGYDANIYYTPEKFNLEIVGTFEREEPCYSFNTVLVTRNLTTGQFYVATDAGCSCASPFEYHDDLNDLTPLDAHATVKEIRRLYDERYDKNYVTDIESLVSKIMSY